MLPAHSGEGDEHGRKTDVPRRHVEHVHYLQGFGGYNLGFKVQGSGFRVQGLWFRVKVAGFRAQGLFRV